MIGLSGLPLTACQPASASQPLPPELGSPRAGEQDLLLLLVAGLNLSDLLVTANADVLPHVEQMLRRGVLVEGIVAESGWIYTPEEMRRAMIGSWRPGAQVHSSTKGECAASDSARERNDGWGPALGLRCLFAAAAEQAASGEGGVLVEAEALLHMQLEGLLLDERQPGYSAERALAAAEEWQQALRVLDSALGQLLEQVDLSCRSVALASTCEAWPVFAGLSLGEVEASRKGLLAGGAIAEVSADASWPHEGAWAEVVKGRPPMGSGAVRLLAPAGHAFLALGQRLLLARPHPVGFILAVGGGLPQGVRLPSQWPEAVGTLLARLRAGVLSVPGAQPPPR